MSRTIFTSKDMRAIIEEIFNGNMRLWKLRPKTVVYSNPNSETVALYDCDTDTSTSVDLAQYLNVTFYTWKNRLVEVPRVVNSGLTAYDAWIESLNGSMNESYALVEIQQEENVQSQTIDAGKITAQITFLVQTNKIENLEYYVSKLKNKYLGNPQTINDASGGYVTAYIGIGGLSYDTEPQMTPLGETIIATVGFSFNYIANASTASDIDILVTINPDENEPNTVPLPYTKITWENIVSSEPVPSANFPFRAGAIAQLVSPIKAITFFDFPNDETCKAFNSLFWGWCALTVNGAAVDYEVNIPVEIVVVDKHTNNRYVYRDVLTDMKKVLTNGDFTVNSLSLKGWARD